MTAESPTPETLLAHAGWVQALARSLVQGAQEAEDLAQDAMLRALERPGPVRSPRAWLGTVVRNLAGQRAREGRHRRERERGAARGERLPSSGELVERMGLHRLLVDEVSALREPYRSTVILRFFEGLPPRAIARRAGVPVATVQSRLTRALAELRARLDRRNGGDRTAWLSALAPIARLETAGIGTVLGALVMTKTATAVAVAVVAATAILWWSGGEEAGGLAPVGDAGGPEETSIVAAEDASSVREPVAEPVSASAVDGVVPDEPAVAAAAAPRVQGIVVDPDGRPVADLALGTAPPLGEELVSDAQGRFTLPAPERSTQVFPRRADMAAVALGHAVPSEGPQEVVVVVAPAIRLAGRVVDGDGAPIRGAMVSFTLSDAWRAGLSIPVEGCRVPSHFPVNVDGDGRFVLEDVPAIGGAFLDADTGRDDFEMVRVDAPTEPRDDLEIVLPRVAVPDAVLRGLVLDAEGVPAPAAAVIVGPYGSAHADAEGRFELDRGGLHGVERLVAVLPRHLPGELARPAGGWPERVELRLGGPTLAIAGRLLDAQGEPVPGLAVWIDDPTPLGTVAHQLTYAERFLAGGLRGIFSGRRPITDQQGRFRIEGLLPRDYTLAAADPETLEIVRRADVAAGLENVELCFTGAGERVALEGVVVDGAGRPLAGVTLGAGVVTRVREWPGARGPVGEDTLFGPEAVSDAQGHFSIEDVPATVDRISVAGELVLPTTLILEPGADRAALELAVEARCHLQVEAAGTYADADRFQVLDADGDACNLWLFQARAHSSRGEGELVEGRSPVYAVSDRARTVVLRRGREELGRVPVEPVPGEVTQVRAE